MAIDFNSIESIIAGFDKILNLELPIGEYEKEVKNTFSMFSDLLEDYIEEYEKLMNYIYDHITPELRKEIGYTLYYLQQRITVLVSGLDLLARIYTLEWHGRGDWPMRSLERIGNLAIKFLI